MRAMIPYYEENGIRIYNADCRATLTTLADCSVDSIVTDPPYELGFMGKAWDRSGIAYQAEVWRECLRVLKPGGYLLAFGGSRTYHRLACAIEDAGFEIRDDIDFWYDANPIFAVFYDSLSDEQKETLHQSAGASHLSWVYGSGFPKSLDVSKAIDAAAGVERAPTGIEPRRPNPRAMMPNGAGLRTCDASTRYDAPATNIAKQWNGWGTALKPAHEPIVLARKPLIGTVAQNILEHGTGGLNIDGCRVEIESEPKNGVRDAGMRDSRSAFGGGMRTDYDALGRWPANVIHDGSEEVLAGFPETTSNGQVNPYDAKKESGSIYGKYANEIRPPRLTNVGSAARFFYCAKASREDREDGCESLPLRSAGEVTDRQDGTDGLNSPRAGAGRTNGSRNFHPTVKPTDLMRYLCRLVTPPNGTVLDPFCGSGSTGRGAVLEGFNFIGIELDAEYCAIAEKRIAAITRQGLLVFA